MLMMLMETLRKWETHCLTCEQCSAYESLTHEEVQFAGAPGPCGIGRALILNLLHVLERGI